MIKKKFAKGGAMLLSAALLATTILPNFPKVGTEMEAEAFQSATGVCTDHGGSYCTVTPDVYVDMLHDLTKLTYGTEEYNKALQENIQILHSTISADDNVCLQVFWAGIACWLSNNITGYGDMKEIAYWYKQAVARYQQAESSGYVTANDVGIWTGGNYTLPPVTEL